MPTPPKATGWARSIVGMVELLLPRAPSANELFYNKPGKGRVRTERYNSWRTAAGNEINATKPRPGCVEGPYALTIEINTADPIDLGNSEKALSDLLQEHGIIDNDRLAARIVLERSDDVPLRQMRVFVVPWPKGRVVDTVLLRKAQARAAA